MINRKRIFIKRIGLIFLFYFTQTVFGQQSLDVATFTKLQTTEERLDFLSTENVDKMGKATFEALLPIIEQQKEGKTLFYWHYQHHQFAGRFNYGQEEYQKSYTTMLEIAQKKRLKVEEVVAQYKSALDNYGGKKISEQEIYFAYLNCFEQMKSLGIENFKRYSLDWMLHNIINLILLYIALKIKSINESHSHEKYCVFYFIQQPDGIGSANSHC